MDMIVAVKKVGLKVGFGSQPRKSISYGLNISFRTATVIPQLSVEVSDAAEKDIPLLTRQETY